MQMLIRGIRNELNEVKKAPVSALTLLIFAAVLTTWFWRWYNADEISRLKENIARYKIAAGVDKPTDKTAMTELRNSELKEKAAQIVEKIREVLSEHEFHMNRLFSDQKTEADETRSIDDEMKRAWSQFESIRVDAIMLNDELRARVPAHIQQKIITPAPRFSSADQPEAEVTIHRMVLTHPSAVSHARVLASELEELAKVQLDKLVVCDC